MINLKIAILDMYKGAPNQGMRNIHEIIDGYAEDHGIRWKKRSLIFAEKWNVLV